jgi:phosphoserine phosphatase
MPDTMPSIVPPLPDEAELPPELAASVKRHHQHLAALVTSLRAAGVDEDVVTASVTELVESYGRELTAAMQAVVRGTPDV